MTAPRSRTIDRQGVALAREMAQQQRKTCQGCHWLKLWPRGMCIGENSPHYRNVRDTHHERCDTFAFRTMEGNPTSEAPPLSRFQIAGEAPGRKRLVKQVRT